MKGQDYFASLMGELHDVLNEAHEDILTSQGEDFISGIQKVTKDITDDLNSQIGIRNTIQVPSDFRQLFSNLDFGVRLDGNTYHLKQRGDGIKIRHIPIILKYMSEQEKNISRAGYVKPDTIWGFEEPENNLEMKYAFDLAEVFKKYSSDIQIFITTHSPAFYALDKNDTDKVSTFYISQGDDECTSIKKVTHKDTDLLHDHMGLLPIITPYLSDIYEKQKEIARLKDQVQVFNPEVDSVVLSEDEDMSILKVLMNANGCDLDNSEFITFKGAGNINTAITLGKYIRDQRPDTKIIIHRDRDYLDDTEIASLSAKANNNNMFLYVPSGVDVESNYLCPYHINHIYPDLTIEQIEVLIEKATDKAKDDSIDRLIEETFKSTKIQKQGNAKRFRSLQAKYDEDPIRYRYGKKVAGVLTSLLQRKLKKNPNIYQTSEFLKTVELSEIFYKN